MHDPAASRISVCIAGNLIWEERLLLELHCKSQVGQPLFAVDPTHANQSTSIKPRCTSNVRHYGLWHELTAQMTADTATWIVLSRQPPLSHNIY